MIDDILDELMALLKAEHSCHTLILYGSHARGDATDQSDLDLLAIADKGKFHRIGKVWKGHLLDVFVYPEKDLPHPKDLLRLEHAKILVDPKGIAQDLLRKVAMKLDEPVRPLAGWDKELRKTWIKKMYERSKLGDVEGHYRLHWLLFDLLENWFNFNEIRYRGSKEAFAWLKKNNQELYFLFEKALVPGAPASEIEKLINSIVEK